MASCNASALTTVASMPMVSDVVRSRPWDSPVAPRQMLPPPITMASSNSSSARALAISRANRSTTAPSMVSSDAEDANASPDILRTTRRRAGGASAPDNDLCEPHDLRVADDIADRALLVLGERLLEQATLFEPAVHASLDDLRHGGLGLPLVARDLLHGGALGFDLGGRHVVPAQVGGAGEGDVHGDVVGKLVRRSAHLDQHGVDAAS